MSQTVVVTAPVVIVVPQVPNFIQIEPGDGRHASSVPPVDIARLTTAQLQRVGEAWTSKLIAHAAARREVEQETK